MYGQYYKIYHGPILFDSSVDIAMSWTTGVRLLVGARYCSLLHSVQTDCGVHPASYSIGIRGSFTESKAIRI
jgi:hypothetical protein